MICFNCLFDDNCNMEYVEYDDCYQLNKEDGCDVDDEDDAVWEEMSYSIVEDRWNFNEGDDEVENLEDIQKYVSKIKLDNVYGGDYREYEEILFSELGLDEFGDPEFDFDDIEEIEW